MEKTVIGNVVSIGGVKVCKKCGRPFRFMSINGMKSTLIDSVDENGVNVRAIQHTCEQSASDAKALRSTISHCKQMIGRPNRCNRCNAMIRMVYLLTEDVWVPVVDLGLTTKELMSYTGPLVAHSCNEFDQAKIAEKRAAVARRDS